MEYHIDISPSAQKALALRVYGISHGKNLCISYHISLSEYSFNGKSQSGHLFATVADTAQTD